MDGSDVVAIVSIVVGGVTAVWSLVSQRRSTREQLDASRSLALDAQKHEVKVRRDERTWDARVAMLRQLNDLTLAIAALPGETGSQRAKVELGRISSVLVGPLRTEIELWGSEDLKETTRILLSKLTRLHYEWLNDPVLLAAERDMSHAQDEQNETDFFESKHEQVMADENLWRATRLRLTEEVAETLTATRKAIHAETRP